MSGNQPYGPAVHTDLPSTSMSCNPELFKILPCRDVLVSLSD